MPRLRGTDSKRTDSHRRRGEHGVEAPAPDRAGRRSVPEHAPSETTDSFQLFLNQASRYPLLTREEEVDLAQRIERGDLAAKELLINSNLRLVVKFARRYEGHGLPIQDLVQEAMLGLIRAAEKFDWRRGYKFSTYAVLWIKQSIQRGLDNTGRPVRIPAHVAQRERTVNRVDAELSTKLNREPTDEEVARAAKLPLDEVQAVRDLTRVTTSLDAPVGDGDTSLGELRGGTEPSVEEEVVGRDREDAVSSALSTLPEDERRVIELRFGTGNDPEVSLRDVARRLGVTQARARELEARGLRRLAHDDSLAAWRAAA
jgi:RNA polymerase primary sigma factor